MPIQVEEMRELLRGLVATDSVNCSLVPGARGEAEAARMVRDWLCARGVPAVLQHAAQTPRAYGGGSVSSEAPAGPENRPNVVATIGPAEALRPALLVIAHLDTVGAGDMPEPFVPRERDGMLHGRGALDIKSGVAAMCAAAVAVVREGVKLARPFVIAGVVDEECDSLGTQALLRQCTADAAVVLEPTDLRLCVAHKGYAWFEIITRGRAAHGSSPAEGRDAICYMGRVLGAIEQLGCQLASRPPHPLLGTASVHASLISGGQELSSYPAECRLQIERRTLPGETPHQLEEEIHALLESLRRADADFHADFRLLSFREPYSIAAHEPIVQASSAALREVTGAAVSYGMPVWTDTALLAEAGIPGVVLGPRGKGLHASDEQVDLTSVTDCAEVLRRIILRLCT
jgi:acetylornithine deacetylase